MLVYKQNFIIALLAMFIYCHLSFCQDAVIRPYPLTHQMTPQEKQKKDKIGRAFTETNPPAAPVRNIAEWEHCEGVLIGYPGNFGLSYSLIKELAEDVMVTTVLETTTQKNSVTNNYTSNGVNINHCNFLIAPIQSYWTRDFSPWYIADASNKVAMIDFIYNRPRPDDDNIPVPLSDFLNEDLYGMKLESAGGNYMCDGMGIGASTDLIEEENNNLTTAQINKKMLDYLGIKKYHITIDPPGDYIKHIDCWGKFLDVDKVLIGQVAQSNSQYYEFEQVADYFANETSSYGTNYEVYRVYTPGGSTPTPYTNSLIINNKVFVPQTGSQYDDDAINTYKQAMPGYEIIGFTGSWEPTDALHCRTYGIPDRSMLYIKHIPISGVLSALQDGYMVTADIVSYGGNTIITDSVKVFYKINNGNYLSVPMSHSGNTYSGTIPKQAPDSDVAYYIHAADNSGRKANHPYIGAPDPHRFKIDKAIGIPETSAFTATFSNFPNPFKNATLIHYEIPDGYPGDVAINLYFPNGQLIKTLVNHFHKAGNYNITLDAVDLPGGIYLCKIQTEYFCVTRQMIHIK